MPPSPQNPNTRIDPDHMLPPHVQAPKKQSAGPIVGMILIVVLLVFGALYFWGAHLNKENSQQTLPLIQGDSSY